MVPCVEAADIQEAQGKSSSAYYIYGMGMGPMATVIRC